MIPTFFQVAVDSGFVFFSSQAWQVSDGWGPALERRARGGHLVSLCKGVPSSMFPVPVLEDSVSGDHVDVIVGDLETSAVHSAISEAASSQTQGTACGIDI